MKRKVANTETPRAISKSRRPTITPSRPIKKLKIICNHCSKELEEKIKKEWNNLSIEIIIKRK